METPCRYACSQHEDESRKMKFNKLERKDRREISIAQVGSNVNSARELKVRIANGLGALLGLTKIWLKGNLISQKTKIRF